MSAFLILFFLVAIVISVMGLDAVSVGKSYYREAVFKKTLIERELGLLKPIKDLEKKHGLRANFSISVTQGQQNHHEIFESVGPLLTQERAIIPWESVTGRTKIIFWAMVAIESLGCFASAARSAMLLGN